MTCRWDFPTGNARAHLTGDHLFIDRDLRDSTGDRWYWHLGLFAETTCRIQCRMARPSLTGRFGPWVDCGDSQEWHYEQPTEHADFDIDVGVGQVTRLSATIPYGAGRLNEFRRRIGPVVRRDVLCLSEGARPVDVLTVAGSSLSSRLVVLTARHHACEAMASFVLEGAVEQFVELTVCRHPAVHGRMLIAVPLVDVDGVERGDQGKGRLPWDHNRDYGEQRPRYASTNALRHLLDSDPRPTVALDLHTPGLRGHVEEQSYVIASGDHGDADAAQALVETFTAQDRYSGDPPSVLPFDERWNSVTGRSHRCFAAWLRSRAAPTTAFTIEFPNAVDRGTRLSPDGARCFGRALLSALLENTR